MAALPLKGTSVGAAARGGVEREPAAGQQLEHVMLRPNEVRARRREGSAVQQVRTMLCKPDSLVHFSNISPPWQLPSPPPGKPPQYDRTPLSEINTASEQNMKDVVAREFHLSDPRFLMRVTAFV